MVVHPSPNGDVRLALRNAMMRWCSETAKATRVRSGQFLILAVVFGFWPAVVSADVDLQPPVVEGQFRIPTERLVELDSTDPDAAYLNQFHLRRATRHIARGDYKNAVDELSQCDWTHADDDMDRAAFLLGMSYLRLGHRAGFLKLANTVSTDSTSPFLACLRRQAIMISHHADTGDLILADDVVQAAVDEGLPFAASIFGLRGDWEMAESLLVRAPRSIFAEYLRVVAAEARGADAELHLQEIVRRPPSTDLEIQLVSIAQIRLARRASERNGDPISWLENLDPASRWASHGNHLKALYQISAGDSLDAVATLTDLVQADPNYERRDELERLLGSIALAQGDDERAFDWFAAAAKSWDLAWAALEPFDQVDQIDRVVRDWENEPAVSSVLVLDANGFREDLGAQLGLALTVGRRDAVVLPRGPLGEVSGPRFLTRVLPHPPVEELREISAAHVMAEEAYYEWERNQWLTEQARIEMARHRAYLERGRDDVDRILLTLSDVLSHVGLLQSDLPRILDDLDRVEAAMLGQIEDRTARILAESEDLRLRIDALDHFYVEGPHRGRPEDVPDLFPSPEAVMDDESALSRELSMVAERFAEVVPDQIRRSASELWRPRLMEGISGLSRNLRELIARAERIRSDIDGSIESLDRGAPLARLADEGRRLRAIADDLALRHQRLGREVATRALERRRSELSSRKEGIDYTLAYGHFVAGLSPEAIRLHDDFLVRFPESTARAEVHFRLANLHLDAAKTVFRADMEQLVARQQRGDPIGIVPVLDVGRALEHYEKILQLELPFDHLDAVLYHVGVIRADDGDPSGVDFLERLVDDFPASRFVQEAQIRSADFYFDDERLGKAAELYAIAATGSEPALQAIALYKLGWSHFNRDRFSDAADAFAQVLDLYRSEKEFEVDVDLQAEADDYLVHALARLGGGEAVAEFFLGRPERSYTSPVISGVSSLLRRFSLFGEAVETDRVWLHRYPNDPRALIVAKQVIDGYEQWNRSDRARQSRLEMAELFLPEGSWYAANPSDSLRYEANRFSEYSYRSVALYHHHEAREGKTANSKSHWSESRRLYHRMLELWPQSAQRARTEFYSGEAARELGEYEEAAAFFASASEADSAGFALEASWQHVATLQQWYAETPAEQDALVERVLQAGNVYLEQNPYDLRGNDLVWSQGQLAFAHGMDDRAADEFGRFVTRYPGDERAPRAAALRADAFYRVSRFTEAGTAYEDAALIARQAGQDSLATRMKSLAPHSFYRHAESVAQGSDATAAAPAFEDVARRWPGFDLADNALYRAGIGYLAGKELSRAEAVFEELLRSHPDSDLARDTYLELAGAYEDGQRVPDAARLFETFSETYPKDEQADDALLHAADLWSDFGDEPASERVQLVYIDRFPEDRETAAFVLHKMAERDLQRAESSGEVSWLLTPNESGPSYLSRYLRLEEESGEKHDPSIDAQVAFLLGEEGRRDYLAYRLTLPLAQSIAEKNSRLDAVLSAYRRSTDLKVSPWSQASFYRIGEALVAFGEGIVASERPADLSSDDRAGYDEVLEEQAWGFYDRGEEVWTEMLKTLDPGFIDEGEWVERTKVALWPRIAQRFLHYAEVDYPVVFATPARAGQ